MSDPGCAASLPLPLDKDCSDSLTCYPQISQMSADCEGPMRAFAGHLSLLYEWQGGDVLLVTTLWTLGPEGVGHGC